MKIEDVHFGMKVVPHDKTAKGWSNFVEWRNSQKPCALFFSEHGFLYVKAYDEDENAFPLYTRQDGIGGDYFRASDFSPAEIEVGDEVETLPGAPYFFVDNAVGRVVGPTVVDRGKWLVRVRYSGFQNKPIVQTLGFELNELSLVRKAHCIKPEAVEEAEPKAPETVRMETNAAGGTQSAIGWSIREYVAPSLRRVAAVAKHGLDTYGEGNYAKIPRMDNLEHAVRHITIAIEESHGLPIPPDERGEDHLAHAVCRLMMAMTNETKEVPFDD